MSKQNKNSAEVHSDFSSPRECPECGARLPGGALYCSRCKQKVSSLPLSTNKKKAINGRGVKPPSADNPSIHIAPLILGIFVFSLIISAVMILMPLRNASVSATPAPVSMSTVADSTTVTTPPIDNTDSDSDATSTLFSNADSSMDTASGNISREPSVDIPPSREPDATTTDIPDIPTSPSSTPSAPAEALNNGTTSTKYLYNCDYGLWLWKDTDCSDYYCIILAGDAVSYIEDIPNTRFSKVSYDNYVGYINKSYLSDTPPYIDTTIKYVMYCTTDNVNFRTGPSTDFTSLYYLNTNDTVGYIRDMVDTPEFAKVNYKGIVGYISKKFLSAFKITTSNTNP